MSYLGIQISRLGRSACFLLKIYFGAADQCRHRQHRDCIFLRSKKNNIKWRRRRKILGVRCKNLAFYTTEPLNEPFFAEQKMKNGAAGKKKNQGTAISQGIPVVQPRFYQAGKKCGGKNRVRPNLGTTFTERPGEKCRFFFSLQISLFFFFFLKTSFWKNWFSKPVFLTTLIP